MTRVEVSIFVNTDLLLANHTTVSEKPLASEILFNVNEVLNNALLKFSLDSKNACNVTTNYSQCLEIRISNLSGLSQDT